MTSPFEKTIHPLGLLAAKGLMFYLEEQKELAHEFGLLDETERNTKGKMFGVLVVETPAQEIAYLSAFSGKLGGSNHHPGFVPPVYDALAQDGFLSEGMIELRQLTERIQAAKIEEEKEALIATRALTSAGLQSKLFDQYHFSNGAGLKKGLRELFNEELGKNPPTAAGECAAPKLLQYAFDHNLRPLALAEFWWGASTRSAEMKHKEFYPPCEDKCHPILNHMLS